MSVVDRLSRVRLGRFASATMLAIAIGVAVVLLARGGSSILKQSAAIDVRLVILSFVIECSGLLIAVPVWRQILASYGIHQPARNDLLIYCYSLLGTVLPGGIWSMMSRSVLYGERGISGVRVASASVVEALATGIAATGVYAIASTLQPGMSLWQRPEIGFGSAFVALILLHPRVFNGLVRRVWIWSKRADEPISIGLRPGKLMGWIGLEVIVVLIGGLALFILLASLVGVSDIVAIQVITAWAAASAAGNLFFWLPGTFVLRDGALILALSSSLPVSVAVLFAILARVWTIGSLLALAGLVWLVLDLPYRNRRPIPHRD
ncbi:MAG TPA: hypothetical protein VJ793_27930 [Anaerolineae bacterium]|nr:hypothetical protein [Anaerolineae bacterium]